MKTTQSTISGFGEILLFLIAGILFIVLTLLLSKFIRPNRPNPEKLSTYESGEEPISNAWSQFNIRFYIVALIFLLFEVEIILLFPWTTVFADKNLIKSTNGMWGWFSLIEAIIFIVILTLGLIYAWVCGHLDWIKPEPSPTKFKSPVPADYYKQINDKYSKANRKAS